MHEAQRQAYLQALNIASWVPRGEMPGAAPSAPEVLAFVSETGAVPASRKPAASPAAEPAQNQVVAQPAHASEVNVAAPVTGGDPLAAVRQELHAEPAQAPVRPVRSASVSAPKPSEPLENSEPAPRFTVQFARAGALGLWISLPLGEPLGERDPVYRLLADMLLAVGAGKPVWERDTVHWPLDKQGNLPSDVTAARDYLSILTETRHLGEPLSQLWLIGTAPQLALAEPCELLASSQLLDVPALCLPELEALLGDAALKKATWHSLKRFHWQSQ